jgi:hypothetical protein
VGGCVWVGVVEQKEWRMRLEERMETGRVPVAPCPWRLGQRRRPVIRPRLFFTVSNGTETDDPTKCERYAHYCVGPVTANTGRNGVNTVNTEPSFPLAVCCRASPRSFSSFGPMGAGNARAIKTDTSHESRAALETYHFSTSASRVGRQQLAEPETRL